jgi:hypothetical protein
MDEFKQKIQSAIKNSWLQFPWIEEEVIVEKTLASAEEFVLSNIAADLLSRDDQDLFRDAYLSAPDIFDADEFLSERISNYDTQVHIYFENWLINFKKSL